MTARPAATSLTGRLAAVLRPHQQRAVADIVAAFDRHERATATMPCGAGKTWVGCGVAEELGARLTVVVVPSLALIAQTLTAWRRAGNNADALVVCSDPTTAAGVAERRSADGAAPDATLWPSRQAVVTTETSRVTEILRRRRPAEPLAVFSTYHSVRVVADAVRAAGCEVDVLVADLTNLPTKRACRLRKGGHGPLGSGLTDRAGVVGHVRGPRGSSHGWSACRGRFAGAGGRS